MAAIDLDAATVIDTDSVTIGADESAVTYYVIEGKKLGDAQLYTTATPADGLANDSVIYTIVDGVATDVTVYCTLPEAVEAT